MAKWRIVSKRGGIYNSEPFGYSAKAIGLWQKSGFEYIEGNWDSIKKEDSFPKITGLIVRLAEYVGSDILSKFPDLEFVVSATTGHDHLDLQEMRSRGVKLYSLRLHKEFLDGIPSTAEHTWALLMGMLRKTSPASFDVIKGNWNRDNFRGNQLKGKVFGIVGLGRTGLKVAKYAEVFNMSVQYFDPYVDSINYKKVDTIEQLFESSDIVSLHVHLNDETEGIIDYRLISKMNKESFLINTSRGKIWSEEDVSRAINEGFLSGVATDVLSYEMTDLSQSPLLKASQDGRNVLITPHIGGATWEAMWDCEEFMANQVKLHYS